MCEICRFLNKNIISNIKDRCICAIMIMSWDLWVMGMCANVEVAWKKARSSKIPTSKAPRTQMTYLQLF